MRPNGNLLSLVINPKSRHYAVLKARMTSTFEDRFYDEEAIYLERNSRDFRQRVQAIDTNAEAVCDMLRSRSVAAGARNAVIKEVFYPKYITPENYECCRVKTLRKPTGDPDETVNREGGGGFGCLFSLTFTSAEASQAFFEALDCFKGLSFGLNITVACPFAVSSATLGWGAPYGIEDSILRISVGLEDTGLLLQSFGAAVNAAEAAISTN
jgi:cystathionine gamma-synthase